MFDVSWVDPTSETVAQRRNRKDREDVKTTKRGRRSSLAGTISSTTSSQASKSKNDRGASPVVKKSSHHKSLSLSGTTATSDSDGRPSTVKRPVSPINPFSRSESNPLKYHLREESHRDSKPQVTELWAGESTYRAASPQPAFKILSLPVREDNKGHTNVQTHELWAGTTKSSDSSIESVFASWHERPSSANSVAESTRTVEIQPLSPMSFITRSTEVTITVTPQDASSILKYPSSEVHISADVAEDFGIYSDRDSESSPPPPFERIPPPMFSGGPPPLPIRSQSRRNSPPATSPQVSIREIPSPINTPPQLSTELWRPPDNWQCPPESAMSSPNTRTITPRRSRQQLKGEKNVVSTTEIETATLRRHIRRMEAASPKIMLERLKEEWTTVEDATIYKEMEFEKQLWMLTALKWLTMKANTAAGGETPDKPLTYIPGPFVRTKVLSLYESKASASFLATHTNSPQIHHLSTGPVSSNSHPTIQPLSVPTPNLSIPYAASLFTKITSLPLPTLLPSSSLPGLLRECHRLLTSAGTLHLTLLDPSPVSSTTGPKLRTWLDDHLLFSLETKFRCTNPGRLIPIWLVDTGFLTKTVIVDFVAAPVPPPTNTEAAENGNEKKDAMEVELQTLVGRMLWQEVWGPSVVGDVWWWENEEIMEECKTMGTKWECKIVEATKRS